jgi:Protein of unknown function (DUF2946)
MQTWRKSSIFHWLAIAVMLWGFLLPSVSQALGLNATTSHSVTDEVCSASGTHSATQSSLPDDTSHSVGDHHCPLCNLHTTTGGPVQPVDLSFELSQSTHWVPVLYLQARAQRFAWVQHPAQAPPLASALI